MDVVKYFPSASPKLRKIPVFYMSASSAGCTARYKVVWGPCVGKRKLGKAAKRLKRMTADLPMVPPILKLLSIKLAV